MPALRLIREHLGRPGPNRLRDLAAGSGKPPVGLGERPGRTCFGRPGPGRGRADRRPDQGRAVARDGGRDDDHRPPTGRGQGAHGQPLRDERQARPEPGRARRRPAHRDADRHPGGTPIRDRGLDLRRLRPPVRLRRVPGPTDLEGPGDPRPAAGRRDRAGRPARAAPPRARLIGRRQRPSELEHGSRGAAGLEPIERQGRPAGCRRRQQGPPRRPRPASPACRPPPRSRPRPGVPSGPAAVS